jgi:hypothetical protein
VISPTEPQRQPSILRDTIRRSLRLGRIFIIGGLAYVFILSTISVFLSGSGAIESLAVYLPIFAVLGAMGGLTVFAGDRVKGVYEYLIAYGFSPMRLFVNILVACLILVTMVLGIGLGYGLGLYLGRGESISAMQVELLGLYSVPMSYACAALAATVGMFWTTLSTPRQGMNSPIGLMPLVGIAPSVLTLVAVGVAEVKYGPGALLWVTSVAVILVAVVALGLLSQVPRLLSVERFLSPI